MCLTHPPVRAQIPAVLQRKDLLMREKAGLLESETNFGQQRKNWIEPLRSFVLSLKEAEKVAQTKNYAEWRNFFRSLGSNPEIKDKTVSIRWGGIMGFHGFRRRRKGFWRKSKRDFGFRKIAPYS